MSRLGKVVLILFFCISLPAAVAYGENDTADKDRKDSKTAGLTVVNKSPLPVIGVYLQPTAEAKRLATIGRPNIGECVYCSEIRPGASATVSVEPGDYVIRIVKSNGRGDTLMETLKPGQTFSYTIE